MLILLYLRVLTRNLPVQTNCNQEDCVIYCADKARNLPVQTNCNYPEIPANLFMSLATYLYKRIATEAVLKGRPKEKPRNLPVQTNCNVKIGNLCRTFWLSQLTCTNELQLCDSIYPCTFQNGLATYLYKRIATYGLDDWVLIELSQLTCTNELQR